MRCTLVTNGLQLAALWQNYSVMSFWPYFNSYPTNLLCMQNWCAGSVSHKGTYKYGAIKRCQPLVWGNMTHDDASVETGVGGQAKYDVMMVFCGNALQKHHKTLKTSTRRYSDCHILHILNRYNK